MTAIVGLWLKVARSACRVQGFPPCKMSVGNCAMFAAEHMLKPWIYHFCSHVVKAFAPPMVLFRAQLSCDWEG